MRAAALEVAGLSKEFHVRKPSGWGRRALRAVDDVSFAIPPGRTLGLVGESGCGKSTLGRMIVGLIPPTGGTIRLGGETVRASRSAAERRGIQMVFQDPYASLDPRMTIHDVVAEPLRINGLYAPGKVDRLLTQVGLSPEAGQRRPAQFSGGQRQRIAIARALALDPQVLILDEAVSALDVSIQAQIVNLLRQLQRDLGLSYLFISHDLSIVRHISHEVAVMYLGRIVESGPREAVLGAPAHPYTQALLSAVPSVHRRDRSRRIVLEGDLPNPLDRPSACVFRTRCFKAAPRCATDAPALAALDGHHRAACHFAEPTPRERLATLAPADRPQEKTASKEDHT
ncbi:MAG: oligopeptide/dipeptide ABC transporter ATP-binding protein [Paracoccaceae bacterium]|jgi:peptide/nickel transport system ATP-binding protein|nr:oligopeptide/dipeptide ABC transporter ATP-binding protein [Paracoccaceae bacterium]